MARPPLSQWTQQDLNDWLKEKGFYRMAEELTIYGEVDGYKAVYKRTYSGVEGDELNDNAIQGCVAWLGTQGFTTTGVSANVTPTHTNGNSGGSWQCGTHGGTNVRDGRDGGKECGAFQSGGDRPSWAREKPWGPGKDGKIRWYCASRSN
ncbi:MAG: hypothetical protein KGL39_51755 [Patescibacteria group bacterium]|nr:hypothetical protein [Patescibacteria group bacterium]